MVAAGLVYMTVTAPQQAFTVMLDGAGNAVELALSLFAVYAVWLSVLEIMDKTGISKAVNRLFSPLWRRIFRGEDEKSLEYISLNFSANLLGMGSAATPMGIKAMESMSRGREKASDNMILFLVFNATSIQLIPATVIGMRAASGSASSAAVPRALLRCRRLPPHWGGDCGKALRFTNFSSHMRFTRANGNEKRENALLVPAFHNVVPLISQPY